MICTNIKYQNVWLISSKTNYQNPFQIFTNQINQPKLTTKQDNPNYFVKKDVTRPSLTNCQFTISQRFGINGPKSSKEPILIAISRQECENHYCRNIKTL